MMLLDQKASPRNDPDESRSCDSDLGEIPIKSEELEIAADENKSVQMLRLMLVLVLVSSAIGVAMGVHSYVKSSEKSAFESKFNDEAFKVLSAMGVHVEKSLAALDALVLGIVSHSRATNQSFPFVTVPDFYLRVKSTIGLSDVLIVSVNPYITPENRILWEQYSIANSYWVNETLQYMERDEGFRGYVGYDWAPLPFILEPGGPSSYTSNSSLLPMWQNAPVNTRFPPFNWNRAFIPYKEMFDLTATSVTALVAPAFQIVDPNNETDVESIRQNGGSVFFQSLIDPEDQYLEPLSDIIYPIFDHIDITKSSFTSENYVGALSAPFYWRDIMRNILPNGSDGIVVVIDNPCNPSFTYEINGPTTRYIGKGDLHDGKYDRMGFTRSLHDLSKLALSGRNYNGLPLAKEYCPFKISVYPSDKKENLHISSDPVVFACVAASIFVFTSLIFIAYDRMVERRQSKVMSTAVKSSAVVSSLFPATIRDRLLEINQGIAPEDHSATSSYKGLNKMAGNHNVLADLFPETTVMFADIAGFTAWSSVREPYQVFTLLEAVYAEFDLLARQHGVFKVETIGDCYVAVCGLPSPRKKHAAVMARFARDCRDSMIDLAWKLEQTLGPGTANLALRIGLHSGPTVAGVLRGDKSRFQLFGDTMNTASRMESTGQKERIHVSQKTADLLCKAGKEHWLTPREDLVEAKGKGTMQTYWCEPTGSRAGTAISKSEHIGECGIMENEEVNFIHPGENLGFQRLVNWNKEILDRLLRKVVARRSANAGSTIVGSTNKVVDISMIPTLSPREEMSENTTSLVEMLARNKILLKQHDKDDPEIPLPSKVSEQLLDFVSVIAHGYRTNPFHNFDHASHVTMAATKLLSRVGQCHHEADQKDSDKASNENVLDPLTEFALTFACLIHDLDHPGVPNAILIKEETSIAKTYKNKSVAEQNSVDIAWNLLKQSCYEDLHSCIFADDSELRHFRQVVVNAVMATDIFDKELITMRDQRWLSVIGTGNAELADQLLQPPQTTVMIPVTVLLDYIMQASDVAHTMQHWSIFEKWNRCLFRELMGAYNSGRLDQNPSEQWYRSEMRFFDDFVIPLAEKLKRCEVFGVYSDELLDYAMDNRLEWEMKGQALVQEWIGEYLL